MLSAREIRHRYSPRGPWILDRVSLQIDSSEIVGLRGASGVGKSTLAKILAGHLRPTAGGILIDGALPPGHGWQPVQMVFQHPELTINPHFRIAQALAEAGADARQLAEDLGVSQHWRTRFPHELSGGELQRVALARALGRGTRYLIADEPTAMLDSVTQVTIWKLLIRAVAERGIGLLAISHDAELLGRVCHRIVDLPALSAAFGAGTGRRGRGI